MLTLAPLLLLVAAPPAAQLPLKGLVLYENGVGYFERRGELKAGQVAEIPLEAGQLDDALKSLVVMSSRGVASVEFAPALAAEAARDVAGLPDAEGQRSLESLVRALQGVDVVVQRSDGLKAQGRVVEVTEEKKFDKDGHELPDPTLVVFGLGGLQRVPLTLVTSVRPTDDSISLAWTRAMGATTSHAEPQRLRVRGSASAGSLAVGYTTEAAVWRTTYRLVTTAKGARLQGYALVHNDSDEAWDGVSVSLASGKPTSFLFPLAGPRYGRRELVSPQDGLDTAPQLATKEAREHLRGAVEGALGLRGTGSGGGGYGTGSGTLGVSSFGTVGHGGGTGVGTSSVVLEDGPTPLEPAAVSEAGDLFLYRVKEPVVLGPRKSALLPIIDGPTSAERVTVLKTDGQTLSGVRLLNSTALTLEGGTLTIFNDGAYAGETQLDRLKPGEVRVLTHGDDLDTLVSRTQSRTEGPVRQARLNGGILELTRVDRVEHTLTVTSRNATPRTVLVELPEQQYRVVQGGEEDVRSPGQPRFVRVTARPKVRDEVLTVDEEGAVMERIALNNLSAARLGVLLARECPAPVKALLTRLKGEVEEADAALAKAKALEVKIREAEADLTRVREDLNAVGKGGAKAQAEKLGEKLLALEDDLKKLRESEKAERARAEKLRQTLVAAR